MLASLTVLFVVLKVYYNFVPLSLFVELSRFIPIIGPVYKDISIVICGICLLERFPLNFFFYVKTWNYVDVYP